MKPVKAFLYGYYGTNNLGDDLLLSAVIRNLKEMSADILLSVRCLEVPLHIDDVQVTFVQIEKVMANQRLSKIHRLAKYAIGVWRSLHGCQIFVFGGGTLFHSQKNSYVNLIFILMWVIAARLRGARVYSLGVGVATLCTWFARTIQKLIISLSEDFAVRDKSSLLNCSFRMAAEKKIRQTSDLIFAEKIYRNTDNDRLRTARVLGVTLAASDFDLRQEKCQRTLRALAESIACLAREGWDIHLLSFQEPIGTSEISDLSLFTNLQLLCPDVSMHHRKLVPDPIAIADQYAQLSVIVGMRFHGHVLAAMQSVPFVGLSDDGKVTDLCGAFNMPIFSIGGFASEVLVNSIIQTQAVRPNLRELNELISKASNNYASLKREFL
ncbi:MAG: polysaccharide pyruvyl transferase family protein [Porticoccaceae bacterium]|jgi:polysaccharide pyruvyl transferase WcaK-like protein|nr:polysaccharide pyruvyl transferase family protein [Porticoccaceae bacterium]